MRRGTDDDRDIHRSGCSFIFLQNDAGMLGRLNENADLSRPHDHPAINTGVLNSGFGVFLNDGAGRKVWRAVESRSPNRDWKLSDINVCPSQNIFFAGPCFDDHW